MHMMHIHDAGKVNITTNLMLPVYLRVRPTQSTKPNWLDIIDTTTVQNGDEQHTFKHVFDGSSTQSDVYAECVDPLVSKLLSGQDQCFFTLGATGSGKTWTTAGSPHDLGVVYRAIYRLYAETNGPIGLSMIEIYNDKIYDLLNSRNPLGLKTANGRCEVGAAKSTPSTFEQAVATMEQGYKQRAVFATQCNSQSSRSHAIIFIEVPALGGPLGGARLTVGDLAGNERVDEAKSTGAQLKEAGEINKSLMVFGQALRALQAGRLSIKGSKLSSLLLVNAEREMPTMLVTMDAQLNQKPGMQVLRYATIARKVRRPRTATAAPAVDVEARLRAELYAETDARLVRVYDAVWGAA